MKTTTPCLPEDDNDGHHFSDGETSHQLGEQKNDGTELTVPSVEGSRVDENQPATAVDDTRTPEAVTPKQRDIFDDLAAFGRPIDEIVPSEKLLTSLSVRKPKRDEWVRVHPTIHVRAYIYEARDENAHYIVMPAVVELLLDVVRYVQLSLAVNYSGGTFVWPVSVPTERKPHRAHITAFAGAERAMREWIRISWGREEYEIYRRSSAKTEPVWPDEITSASEMLRFAAKAGGVEIIDSLDHPVVRALQGRD
ncbi:MAG: hypothetical protein KF712_16095 [Akkermansiaceae bacterium]|nr:hypothetical protein [Akkermansiaceae bacterium]